MAVLFIILAIIASILSLVCTVIILIEAFQDELWKGLLSIFCGLYYFYYCLFDFERDDKWIFVLGSLGGGAVSAGLLRLAGVG
jgi:hypothetical protein